MSYECQNLFVSENSKVYEHLAKASTKPAGKVNSVELPVISNEIIARFRGHEMAQGGYGTVHAVYGCKRVFKIIPLEHFENGNEIIISKIASDIGVAPTFCSACIVQQRTRDFVYIEMDDLGNSLGKWMDAWATPDPFSFGPVKRLKLPLKDAVVKIFGEEEIFYCELFGKIKKLAENNIAYCDSNAGNIMPNYDERNGLNTEKGLQLIDFDAATMKPNTQSAALESIRSTTNLMHLKAFQALPHLSETSNALIAWFQPPLE